MNIPKVLRSLLFVPATHKKFIESALCRGADAIQLDLEDSIALSEKEIARLAISEALTSLKGRTPYIVVRINYPLRLAIRDLEAVVVEGVDALTVPKVPNAAFLQLLDETMADLEVERGLPLGSVGLIALIETAEGLAHLNEIAAATPRLIALTVGSEDLAVSLGSQPIPDALYIPNLLGLTAARRAGIIPLGYIGSIAVFEDKATYRGWIERAASLGFEGAFCIHPNQVAICNELFQPSQVAVDKARKLISAFEAHAAQGAGVFVFEGQMVDAPVVNQARTILAKADAIASR